MHALTLLSDALDVLDQAKAPPEFGARLSALIEQLRQLNL
jgi:hypothetical protein